MSVDVRELMLAGAHFGHRARFWNPKMATYIYGKYHSTHIINLDFTVDAVNKAAEFLKSVAASGGTVLYLCTKNAAVDVLEECAKSVGMPYVNRRWLGGILTNFKTTRNSVGALRKIEGEIDGGALKHLTKKEGIKLLLSKDKLERAIGGIREMADLPDALFVIDAGWHKGAIREANKLGIPIVAVVDTNHSPDDIDYVIPGNDDSRQAIGIYAREMTAAIVSGKKEWEANLVAETRAQSVGVKTPGFDKPAKADDKKKAKVVVAAKPQRDDNIDKKVAIDDADKPVAANKRILVAAKAVDAPVVPSLPNDEISATQVKSLREATGLGMMECKKALAECAGDFEKAQDLLRVRSGANADKVSGRQASEGRIAYAEKGGIGALAEVGCETDFVARDDNMAVFARQIAEAAAGASGATLSELKLADGRTVEDARRDMVMKLGENIAVNRVAVLSSCDGAALCAYVHNGNKIAAMCVYRGAESAAHDVCMHIVAMRPRYLDRDSVPTETLTRERDVFKAQAEESGKDSSIVDKIVAGKIEKYFGEVALLEQPFVKDADKTVRQALAEAETTIVEFKLLIVGAIAG